MNSQPWQCKHANEVPVVCNCKSDCYCRIEGVCKTRNSKQIFDDMLQEREQYVASVIRKLHKIIKLQDSLLKDIGNVSSSLPFSISEYVDRYDEKVEEIKRLKRKRK